ncbi:UDP-glycosyltransferase 88A1 [Linum grandiflorum]
MAAKTEAIVLYPSPAIGHLLSMVELGRLILTRRPLLSIHIILVPSPYQSTITAPYISTISAVTPSITFHHLPPPPPATVASIHHEMLMIETIRLSQPNLLSALKSIISQYDAVPALIFDFFCTAVALSVADELVVPGYQYATSGAASVGFMLHLPTLHEKSAEDRGGDSELEIPGVPKLGAPDVPELLRNRNDDVYRSFLEYGARSRESAGLIVNTFESLESRAVKAISDGLCIPDGPTPPIYCIGPLIASGDGSRSTDDNHCLTWLDSQPKRSVVFLCFGSLGVFSREQLKEIAIGLEKSRERFLWVVRDPPPSINKNVAVLEADEGDEGLETLLPEGFLERTRERGLVVKSWAPQVAVLGHDSVGGFVTHCGWNSVLEAVRAGIPMVAWPLYAEQKLNRVMLVEEIKIALSMEESDEGGFVKAEEVERRVKELMGLEGRGELVRRQAMELKNAAERAMGDGGSSRVALNELIDSWTRK